MTRIEEFENAPTIEPEVRRGRWIDRDAVLSDINEEIEANQEYPEDKLIRKGLRIARKAIENASTVNRWIPVEDALPEEDVSVLCYMRIGEIVVMEYGGDGWYCGVTRYNPRAVTHWMCLPEPPKEDEA